MPHLATAVPIVLKQSLQLALVAPYYLSEDKSPKDIPTDAQKYAWEKVTKPFDAAKNGLDSVGTKIKGWFCKKNNPDD